MHKARLGASKTHPEYLWERRLLLLDSSEFPHQRCSLTDRLEVSEVQDWPIRKAHLSGLQKACDVFCLLWGRLDGFFFVCFLFALFCFPSSSSFHFLSRDCSSGPLGLQTRGFFLTRVARPGGLYEMMQVQSLAGFLLTREGSEQVQEQHQPASRDPVQ